MKRTTVVVLAIALVLAIAGSASAKESRNGTATWIGGVDAHYAATTHGTPDLTFKDGAWLKLSRGSRSFKVHVVDVCDGSACHDLDVSPTAFNRLGADTDDGIMHIKIECGKRGQLPMRKCLAGEG